MLMFKGISVANLLRFNYVKEVSRYVTCHKTWYGNDVVGQDWRAFTQAYLNCAYISQLRIVWKPLVFVTKMNFMNLCIFYN